MDITKIKDLIALLPTTEEQKQALLQEIQTPGADMDAILDKIDDILDAEAASILQAEEQARKELQSIVTEAQAKIEAAEKAYNADLAQIELEADQITEGAAKEIDLAKAEELKASIMSGQSATQPPQQ